MATRTNWKELYQDLPEKVATLLRDARVKPEQLTAKADGEILAIKGITEADLETIRAKYPSTLESTEVKATAEKAAKKTAKAKKAKVEEKTVKAEAVEKDTEVKEAPKTASPFYTYPRYRHGRSARYLAQAKKLRNDKAVSLSEALNKLTKLSKPTATLELHLNVISTGIRGEAKLPFSTGKNIRVEIFSDKTVTALNDGKIGFDILLVTPADMPKVARYAKLLGPKGLMPNPKNGSVTPDPEARAKQLSAGATLAYKTEPKFPIIHLAIGKTNQKSEEIMANIGALIKDIGVTKIRSAFLTATQSPSLKIDVNSL